MITVEYLEDWEQDNGEDVFMDGPFICSDSQWKELGDLIFNRMNKEFNTSYKPTEMWETDMFDYPDWELFHDTEGREICLQSFADIINKYNIKEKF